MTLGDLPPSSRATRRRKGSVNNHHCSISLTQLERVTRTDDLEVRCGGRLLDLAACVGGSGEGDFPDVHVLGEECASLARTRDDVDDSWRKASSSDELAQADRLKIE